MGITSQSTKSSTHYDTDECAKGMIKTRKLSFKLAEANYTENMRDIFSNMHLMQYKIQKSTDHNNRWVASHTLAPSTNTKLLKWKKQKTKKQQRYLDSLAAIFDYPPPSAYLAIWVY